MEEGKKDKKNPVTFREIITDWAINSFFGLYMVYMWLGTDSAKADISAGFGIEFFAISKACVLMGAMLFAGLGGMRLFKILYRLKSSFKFIDPDDEK